MAYHEAFWVAAATAAPVIALANTVTITDVTNVWFDVTSREKNLILMEMYFFILTFSCLNLVAQVLVLSVALNSLLAGRDTKPGSGITIVLAVGLLYVLLLVLSGALLRHLLRKEMEADNKPKKRDAQADDQEPSA